MAAAAEIFTLGVSKVELAVIPTTAAPWTPVWKHAKSAIDASVTVSGTEVEVWGDEILQTTWITQQKASVSFKTSMWSGIIQELVTGNTADTTTDEVHYLVTNKDAIPPYLMVRITVPGKDATTGVAKDVVYTYFKGQVRNAGNGAGGALAKAGETTYEINLMPAYVDDTGVDLPAGIDYAFGKLVIG